VKNGVKLIEAELLGGSPVIMRQFTVTASWKPIPLYQGSDFQGSDFDEADKIFEEAAHGRR
jgi:hypothetical protein